MAQWLVMSYTKYKQVWFLINRVTAKFSSCGPFLARRNSPGWALPLWKWDQLTQPSLPPILPVIPTPTHGSKDMQVGKQGDISGLPASPVLEFCSSRNEARGSLTH